MAVEPSAKGALLYGDEASFGATSTTYDERIPIANNVNDIISGLQQDRINVDNVVQYNNDGRLEALGPYGVSFPVECYLAGHGSSTATGAVGATDVPTFLGRCIGQLNTGTTGGTVNVQSSAIQWSLTDAVMVAGGLCRVGASADGRGNGEWFAVNNATTMTVLNAAEAAPENGDVVYGAEVIHPNETLSTVTSMRFNALTANQRFGIWGGYCSGLELTGLNVGEIPKATATITAARFASESASTFPTAVSTDNFVPAPCTNGAVFVQTVGTTTRAMRTVRDLSISFEIMTYPRLGYDSSNVYQTIVGVTRGAVIPTVSWTEDAEDAGTESLYDIYAGTSLKHIMISLSTADGSAMGFYLPNARCTSPRPTQMDGDGLNQVRVSFQGLTGPTSTTELTHSAWRMGFA